MRWARQKRPAVNVNGSDGGSHLLIFPHYFLGARINAFFTLVCKDPLRATFFFPKNLALYIVFLGRLLFKNIYTVYMNMYVYESIYI